MNEEEGKHKCVICSKRGSKGYFKIPADEILAHHWKEAIHANDQEGQPRKIPKTGKVCFRHFGVNQIDIQPDYVKLKPGKKCEYISTQTY